MKASSVVLLQSDPSIAHLLTVSLSNSFRLVHVARSLDELRKSIAKHKVEAVILDMESASLSDVQDLSSRMPGIRIVCNHRVADEELWMAALSAGAADCCATSDTKAIINASLDKPGFAHSVAA
jgi:DNA-binding NtrC family response regulator